MSPEPVRETGIEDGGPAFPVSSRPCESENGYGHQDGYSTWQYGGLTMRDYFAAKAMAALIECEGSHEGTAQRAYWCADAMIIARKQAIANGNCLTAGQLMGVKP
jgi:hypothetical protein